MISDIENNHEGLILLTGSLDGLIGKLFFKNLTDEVLVGNVTDGVAGVSRLEKR